MIFTALYIDVCVFFVFFFSRHLYVECSCTTYAPVREYALLGCLYFTRRRRRYVFQMLLINSKMIWQLKFQVSVLRGMAWSHLGPVPRIWRKQKKGKRKVQGVHNHKPQPFSDPKRKRKPTNPNKHKSNKRTKSTKISSLLPKRGNRNTKRTEKHKNKMTNGKTYNKSPRRINHKATNSKINTGTTALERSVEQTTGGGEGGGGVGGVGGLKHFYS